MLLRGAGFFVTLTMVSLLAAVYGLGWSYRGFITPRSSVDEFQAIGGDGWIEDGAAIRLRALAPRGNRLLLNFSEWHPPGVPYGHLRVSVCGALAAEFVARPGESQLLYLTGDCEPRQLSFEVLNPYIPGTEDQRKLGARLESAAVSSRLGVPVVRLDLWLRASAAIVLAAVLLWLCLGSGGWAYLSFGIPIAALMLLSRAPSLDYQKLQALWTAFMALALGVWLARFLPRVIGYHKNWKRAGTKEALGPWLLGAIVLVAAALRLYGIDFGLPDNFHPDEVPKLNAIREMVAQGDLNPRRFLHPSLLLYATYLFNNLLHWFVPLSAEWNDTIILAGRLMSATAGTLSVLLLYLIGRRLFDRPAGLIAASILAVAPLHITCSRYVKEDALMVFMLLLSLWLLLKAVQEDRKILLLWAGLLAGATASAKYSGMLAVLPLLGAPWLRSGSWLPDFSYFRWTFLAVLLAPLGFILGSPYVIWEFELFQRGFAYESRHMIRGHAFEIDPWSQYWMYHLVRSLEPGMHWLPLGLALVGLGALLRRGQVNGYFLVALFLLFYLPAEYVRAKPAPQPERYVLPCVPFLALAAGELLRLLSYSRLRLLAFLLIAGAMLLPAQRSAELAWELPHDTRWRMEAWMSAHLPPGAIVFVDWTPYQPALRDSPFAVRHLERRNVLAELDLAKLQGPGERYLLLSSLFYDRYFNRPNAPRLARVRIRELLQLPVVHRVEPRFGTYGFHNPTITLVSLNAGGGTRTLTVLPPPDFESGASANSATPAAEPDK